MFLEKLNSALHDSDEKLHETNREARIFICNKKIKLIEKY